MTLFDGKLLTEREVDLARICGCDHRRGAHRGEMGGCTICCCEEFHVPEVPEEAF